MKEALTSFDLMALVAEWQGLVGGYVDKVYQTKDEVTLRINVPGEDRKELYCKAGKWLVLHRAEGSPGAPGPRGRAPGREEDNAPGPGPRAPRGARGPRPPLAHGA